MRQRIQQISIDHSIALALILFVVILFSALQLTAQEKNENNKVANPAKIENQNSPQVNGDKIEFKNENNAAIITITDEGSNRGSITLPEMSTSPSPTTDKLYNLNGTVNFDGSPLGSGGTNQINDLTDARTLGNSVFLGAGAGNNDDGSDNKNYALGLNSLFSTTSGYSNLGFGYNSLYFNTIGIQNIGLGQGALYYNTEGSGNVAVGYHSNHHNQTGSNNTILGHNAGRGTSTHNKSGNVFIGYEAGYNETGSNKLYIENSSSASPLIYGDFGINQVKINGNLEFTGNLTNNGTVIEDDWDAGIDAGAVVLSTNTLRVGIGTNGGTLEPKLHVKGDEGVLFQGTHSNGTALNLGAGTRFHFYPKKSAIRGGYVDGNQWNDANIGDYSIALGEKTIASGRSSISLGANTTASGWGSVSIGNTTSATGAWSTALGNYVSTSGFAGAFIFGDNSTPTTLNSTELNQMTMRFQGGYRLYTHSNLTTGVYMNQNQSGWTNISDKNKKENFEEINDEELLGKIKEIPVTKWNYKNTDPNIKYIGPMAQDFYNAFHLGGTDSLGINTIAIDGINLAGVKALEKRTREQEERIKFLELKNSELKLINSEFVKRLEIIEQILNNKSFVKIDN